MGQRRFFGSRSRQEASYWLLLYHAAENPAAIEVDHEAARYAPGMQSPHGG